MRELGDENPNFPEPQLAPDEVPDSILRVEDHEVPIEKYISPEERARLDEEERQAKLKAATKTNDAGVRALQQMMGGTLKTKKDLTPLEQVVDREAWMDQGPENDNIDSAYLLAIWCRS